MPTLGSDASPRRGLGRAARAVGDRVNTLVKLELELAAQELKKKVAALGLGIGLGVAAGLFAWFALAFVLVGLALVVAIWLPTWAGFLIVAGGLLLLAGGLGMLALKAIKKGTPPVPEAALEEARLTAQALQRSTDG